MCQMVSQIIELRSLRTTLLALRELFQDLSAEFNSDRPGYVTTMILCCNIIIEVDVSWDNLTYHQI